MAAPEVLRERGLRALSLRGDARLLTIALLALLTCAIGLALWQGAIRIGWSTLFDDTLLLERAILFDIRLPRVALAVLVGGGLAYAGAALQGLLRNPLADPGLIGVSSGGALAAGLYIVLLADRIHGWPALYAQSAITFAGALGACALIFRFAQRRADGSIVALLLVGIAFNAIALAGIGLLTFFSNDEQIRSYSFWTLGTLARSDWQHVLAIGSLMLPAAWWLQRQAQALNVLQLGERDAQFSGVDSARAKRAVLFAVALLTAATVAAAGLIGFVGLMAPHWLRLCGIGDHRVLLPLSALAGAILLVFADTLARTLVIPAEMPVGILTSLLGGPFFLWLVQRRWRGLNG